MTNYRDASTGQFTTAADAAERPAETVSDTVSYRKKPVIIEARQFDGTNAAEIAAWCGGKVESATCHGDKPDIFAATYEAAETVPTRHETPDVAELRQMLDDMRKLAASGGVYNGNRAVLDIIARVEPLLDDADALRARLAHMTEARDAARAEVEWLTAKLAEVRDAMEDESNLDGWVGNYVRTSTILRILDGGAES